MSFTLKPLSNYVVIEVQKKQRSKILIPDTVQKPMTPEDVDAVVVAISEDVDLEGRPMVRTVKVGDKVILDNTVVHTGMALLVKKKEYVVVRENNIIAIDTATADDEIEDLPTMALVN